MAKEGGLKDEDSISLLMQNSVALQKVVADLALDLGKLTGELGQLMSMFREFSKAAGEDKAVKEVEKSKNEELMKKLDTLIDQNKSISKGLVLLESTLRRKARESY